MFSSVGCVHGSFKNLTSKLVLLGLEIKEREQKGQAHFLPMELSVLCPLFCELLFIISHALKYNLDVTILKTLHTNHGFCGSCDPTESSFCFLI